VFVSHSLFPDEFLLTISFSQTYCTLAVFRFRLGLTMAYLYSGDLSIPRPTNEVPQVAAVPIAAPSKPAKKAKPMVPGKAISARFVDFRLCYCSLVIIVLKATSLLSTTSKTTPLRQMANSKRYSTTLRRVSRR